MDELLLAMNAEDTSLHCAAVTVLHAYCSHTKSDYTDYLPLLFRGILRLFTYDNERVLQASWMCLNVITKVGEVKPKWIMKYISHCSKNQNCNKG